MQVPLTRPMVGKEEAESLAAVIQSGWLTQGARVMEFEESVSRYLGVRHCIACTNCTSALHLALLLHDVGPGDEVIVPSYTWIATANAVRMAGATPVFVDIDLGTFNMAPSELAGAITGRTRAIMPVHQFGLPCDMDRIMAVAHDHGLVVVEDAACALGSRYGGKPVGSLGNTACFSFHPRKVITTGEGGMLCTSDDVLAERARSLRDHGAAVGAGDRPEAGTVEALLAEEFQEVGYNYRMTNLQGAFGVVQMARLDEIIASRQELAARYSEAFSTNPCIIMPQVPDSVTTNWQSYVVRIREDSASSRNAVAQALLDAGIACRPGYTACHWQPVYRTIFPALSLPRTESALATALILPLYPQMSPAEQDYVIDTLEGAVAG